MAPSYALVVDPNPSIARRVEQAVAGSGLLVLAARDAVEAAAVVEGNDLSLVLSSVSLPRGNGYDLARDLRERHPAAAVFLMAGGFEVYNPQQAAQVGVQGQVRKPFTVESLRTTLEPVLGPLGAASRSAAPDGLELGELSMDAIEPLAQPSAGGVPRPGPSVLTSEERIATFIPRDYRELTPVAVDPDVVGPAMERAILEVLPVVVQRLLRHSLQASPEFRDMVEQAVQDAVSTQLPGLVDDIVRERLREPPARD